MANDSRTESTTNESIKSLKKIFNKRKKKDSKIPKNNFKRDRSPMEKNRVISKMKSDAQAMGGDFRTASEMKPLEGESQKSFDSRYIPMRKGGSAKKKKSSRKAVRGGGCEIR